MMIVLDEQLMGRGLEDEIALWYRGAVCFISDLRPDTVIKDDALPLLLRQQSQPTFVTINERDFWQRVAIDRHFYVVCSALPDSNATDIPRLLRKLLRQPLFRAKARRMGYVIRGTQNSGGYYSWANRTVQSLP